MTAATTDRAQPKGGAASADGRRVRPQGSFAWSVLRVLGTRVGQLLALLFVVTTVLFFLLHASGDPSITLAGQDATPAQLLQVRARYGLDRPLLFQYLAYLGHLGRLDFGTSLLSGTRALPEVLSVLPATAELAGIAILVELLVAVPLGAWLGGRAGRPAQRIVAGLTFVAQGVPGFVLGLVMIQIFAVRLGWLPSVGNSRPGSWILPSLTLSAFLLPRLTRVLASNVARSMQEQYIQTALAFGARHSAVVVRHAMPNALLGAAALVGGQVALLLSGSLITEQIYAWPGLGLLVVHSVQNLDFPVVQAAVVLVATMVFLANNLMDLVFLAIDPRLRGQRR